ncbi:MAG: hypothetical protein ACFB10_13855 [Salibacteraceae bacterium]
MQYESENEYVKIWVDKGILNGVYKVRDVDLGIAQQCVDFRLERTDFRPFPCYIEMGSIKTMTKEARDHFASERGYSGIVACALLVDSSINRLIGNFFLRISKPKAPTRLFTDKSKAITWVTQFVTAEHQMAHNS